MKQQANCEARGHFKKKAVTAEERRLLAKTHGCLPGKSVIAACIYCEAQGKIHWVLQDRGDGWVQFEGLEIEHIHPEYLGGTGGSNLSLACRKCNRSKGFRTIMQWRRV